MEKSKKQVIYHVTLVILGCVLLGFSTAIFLTKNYIVSGGLSGIGMIFQFYLGQGSSQYIDIVVWAFQIGFWILSIFTLGKKFALQTLIATIFFPASLTLFLRVPCFQVIIDKVSGDGSIGYLLLCALFGGVLNGIGLSLTFLGKGSTGGVDVLIFILKKYLKIRVSVSSFIIDTAIIVAGIFALSFPNYLVNCLCGIITAGASAITVELVYNRKQNAVIVDVVTDKYQEVIDFVIKTLDRSATIIDVTGAYTNSDKKMLRIVIGKWEYIAFKEFIANLDPNAFITFTNSSSVFGEGWVSNNKRITRKDERRK